MQDDFAKRFTDMLSKKYGEKRKAAERFENLRLSDEEVQAIIGGTIKDLSTIEAQQVNRIEEEAARDKTLPEEAVAARRRGAETQTAETLVRQEVGLKQQQDVREAQAQQYLDTYQMNQDRLELERERIEMAREAAENSEKWQTLGFLSQAVSFIPGVGPAVSAGMNFFGNLFKGSTDGSVSYNPATQTLTPYDPTQVGGAVNTGQGVGYNPNAQPFFNDTSNVMGLKPAYRPENEYLLGLSSKNAPTGHQVWNFGRSF
jgi:hypothetical protein